MLSFITRSTAAKLEGQEPGLPIQTPMKKMNHKDNNRGRPSSTEVIAKINFKIDESFGKKTTQGQLR